MLLIINTHTNITRLFGLYLLLCLLIDTFAAVALGLLVTATFAAVKAPANGLQYGVCVCDRLCVNAICIY